jgi:hypothetical protein
MSIEQLQPRYQVTIESFDGRMKPAVISAICIATGSDRDFAEQLCKTLPAKVMCVGKDAAYTLCKELEDIADVTWGELK